MSKLVDRIIIPFTNTARKYGYVTWRKEHDSEIRQIWGGKPVMNLQIGTIARRGKTIDWKNRRISITIRLTRKVAEELTKVELRRVGRKKIQITFL